jgi:hypothetical protein
MSHQVFQNGEGACFDICVSPVDPTVIGSESGTQQPIPGLRHQLSSASLCSEAVSTLDILRDLLAKVLVYDRNFAIWLFRIRIVL